MTDRLLKLCAGLMTLVIGMVSWFLIELHTDQKITREIVAKNSSDIATAVSRIDSVYFWLNKHEDRLNGIQARVGP